MPRLTETAPNRFHGVSDVSVISEKPLIAIVNLETDDGTVELAFSREGIKMLKKVLVRLLK